MSKSRQRVEEEHSGYLSFDGMSSKKKVPHDPLVAIENYSGIRL